jgi:hypothetical protein
MGYPLSAVWGTSSSDVYAAGPYGTILHYGGASWRTVASGTAANLLALWGSSSGGVYAVGWYGTVLRGVR